MGTDSVDGLYLWKESGGELWNGYFDTQNEAIADWVVTSMFLNNGVVIGRKVGNEESDDDSDINVIGRFEVVAKGEGETATATEVPHE